jgi:hypothetical protein
MKNIRIRHNKNPDLFLGPHGWTTDAEKAKSFSDPLTPSPS